LRSRSALGRPVGGRIFPLFARSEPRDEAVKYIRAQMGPAARRNGWQLAEAVGDRAPDRVQRLLYAADWSADAARDRLIDFAIERFGDSQGIASETFLSFLPCSTAAARSSAAFLSAAFCAAAAARPSRCFWAASIFFLWPSSLA
jgi:hypothetical protein